MIESLLQLRNKIIILDDDIIKFLIIHIYSNISLRFMNKDYQRVDEECAKAYKFFLKVFIQSFLEHFKLINNHKIQKTVL